METFLFIGTVLPDTTRVTSPEITVKLEPGPDFPAGELTVQITDSRIIARFVTDRNMSDVECATMRVVAQDIASSVCDAAAILEGAWTVVTIDTCLVGNGRLRMRFGNSSERLKLAFHERRLKSDDIASINASPGGYFLRLALDDLNAGLMEPKFMRSHFYRAVESLRNSVSPPIAGLESGRRWEEFRAALGIDRESIAIFANHAERHGDFASALPMSGKEVEATLVGIADILARYVRWFQANERLKN